MHSAFALTPTTDATQLPRMLTLAEAAQTLQCHRTTVSRLVAQGELAGIRYSSRPGARMLFTEELLAQFVRGRARREQQVAHQPQASSRRRTPAPVDSPWEASPAGPSLW